MADINYDSKIIGGYQPVFCQVCGGEVKPEDSYHIIDQVKRLHYPVCYQRWELDRGAIDESVKTRVKDDLADQGVPKDVIEAGVPEKPPEEKKGPAYPLRRRKNKKKKKK